MSFLHLCCVIEDENIVFLVDVPTQAHVTGLKKEIQRERATGKLQGVDPHTLELWKPRDINAIVAKPADTLLERLRSMGASPSEFAEKLEPTDSLSNIFPTQPSMEHIQIVVTITEFRELKRRRLDEPRTSTKTQAIKPNSMARRWTVNGSDRPGRTLLRRPRTTASQHRMSGCRGKSSIRVTFGCPRIREVDTVIVAQEGAGEHWLLYRVVLLV